MTTQAPPLRQSRDTNGGGFYVTKLVIIASCGVPFFTNENVCITNFPKTVLFPSTMTAAEVR
jgi:hypothetical protein